MLESHIRYDFPGSAEVFRNSLRFKAQSLIMINILVYDILFINLNLTTSVTTGNLARK